MLLKLNLTSLPLPGILIHITQQLQCAQSGFHYNEIQLEDDLWELC